MAEEVKLFTEDELDDMARARKIRNNILTQISMKEENLSNPEMATLLLKAADGLDKAAMGGAKIRVAAKAGSDSKAQMAALVAAMYNTGMAATPVSAEMKQAQNNYKIEDLKPGEDTMGRTPLSLDDIAHVRTA